VQTLQIFLSHATSDRVIAEALKKLLEDLFGRNRVRIDFSSDQEAGSGIAPGVNWFTWITERITRDDKTYVLLTPTSMKKPWVLWESGVAAGVTLSLKRHVAAAGATAVDPPPGLVVPITFGLTDADVPGPLKSLQVVRGDTDTAGGILRELQAVNGALDGPLTEAAFDATTRQWLPAFFTKVKETLAQSSSVENVLATVPSLFSAKALAGLWVTCYGFISGGTQMYHADVVKITADADRRLSVQNHAPTPRTDGRVTPFRNQVEAEVANRHLIGYWKNVSDTRYFGGLHLAVLPGENVMRGSYTSFNSDIVVGTGDWTWVRLEPASLSGVDLAKVTLRPPGDIRATLARHSPNAGPLPLKDVLEG
jgi:hypothetical protein